MNNLKKKYLEFVKNNEYNLEKKKSTNLRVATYNIHYWTDVNEKNSMKKILEDIQYMDADVLFLQEVIFGTKYTIKNNVINTEKIIEKLEKLDYYIIFCNTLPTWFGTIYGNMMCVKNKYKNKLEDSNYTFDKSKKSCVVSGDKEGTKETRCYIKLELLDYVIVGVHLDVCSEEERKKQINIIIKKLNSIKKKIIILGDFNTTDIKQYTDPEKRKSVLKYVFKEKKRLTNNGVINMLEKNGYESSTKDLNINFTVWSGIQSDYIFIKNIKNIKPNILYTESSDHFPLTLDIKL